jgi:hypothetical protein
MLDLFEKKGNDLGCLSNLFGIWTPISAALVWLAPRIWRWFRYSDISTVFSPRIRAKVKQAQIKVFARVAIVDPRPSDFPVRELKAAGYDLQLYRRARLKDIDELCQFDVVLIGMLGVVRDDPNDGVFALIDALRKANPVQRICVAFEGDATVLQKARLQRKVDVQRAKPLSSMECRAVIDDLFNQTFDIEELIRSGQVELDLLQLADKARVMSCLRDLPTRKTTIQNLEVLLNRHSSTRCFPYIRNAGRLLYSVGHSE